MYLASTLVSIHDGDLDRLKIGQQGDEVRIVFEFHDAHTFTQTLILSRANARELLNRLADHLEDTGCCELCATKSTHVASFGSVTISSSTHISGGTE